jgi:hypothetical protein
MVVTNVIVVVVVVVVTTGAVFEFAAKRFKHVAARFLQCYFALNK